MGLRKFRHGLERIRNRIASELWPPYSRLYLAADGADWSLAHDMRELFQIARRLGIQVVSDEYAEGARRQAVFYANQFVLFEPWRLQANRVALSYFHGRVDSTTDEVYLRLFDQFRACHDLLARVQVTNSSMRDLLISGGIDPAKVFMIPIGVNVAYFPMQTDASRAAARRRIGLPPNAVVVGSFQKDGVGWGAGLEPKLIKGPDLLVEVLRGLKVFFPDLFVLLSGPARGFVRSGLEKAGIEYRHLYLRNYPEIAALYQALDLYLVTSREEGGPKAILEAMCSGVPLVTTRVGQASDLVRNGENGWVVDTGDVDALLSAARTALSSRGQLATLLVQARGTAERNSYEEQDGLWRDFFRDFVELPGVVSG